MQRGRKAEPAGSVLRLAERDQGGVARSTTGKRTKISFTTA